MLRASIIVTCSSIGLSCSASAAVVQFGNPSAAFVLTAGGGSSPGRFLDPTLAAGDQLSQGVRARGIGYLAVGGGGSETPNADQMSGGTNLLIARSSSPINVLNSSGILFQFFPAQTFAVDDRIVDQDFQQTAASALFYVGGNRIHEPLLGQDAVTAFRLELADGFHFGWVQWRFGSGPLAGGGTVPMYQPVRWAFETEANVPIVVPTPASSGFAVVAAIGLSARRRRGSSVR